MFSFIIPPPSLFHFDIPPLPSSITGHPAFVYSVFSPLHFFFFFFFFFAIPPFLPHSSTDFPSLCFLFFFVLRSFHPIFFIPSRSLFYSTINPHPHPALPFTFTLLLCFCFCYFIWPDLLHPVSFSSLFPSFLPFFHLSYPPRSFCHFLRPPLLHPPFSWLPSPFPPSSFG